MSFSMKSKTKVLVSNEEIQQIISVHFNEQVLEVKEIVSGYYNAIYYVKTINQEVVLKVAPSDDIDILTYEKDILKREVKVYSILEKYDIPVPKVLVHDYSKRLISSNYYIMNYVEGKTLFSIDDEVAKHEIYIDLMSYLAKIHSIKMDYFGYDNFPHKINTLKEAFYLMIDNLVEDAKRIDYDLPSVVIEVINNIKTLDKFVVFDDKPSLLHFDLWDGNIFVHRNKIVGLIDTERSLNGEPLMEFAAMHKDIFSTEFKPYLDQYNKMAHHKISNNVETIIRYRMYQAYMYILMIVECPYRDVDGSFNDQLKWALNELSTINHYLRNVIQEVEV